MRDSGGSIQEAAAYLAVPERSVLRAMDYYLDFRYEVDAWIEANDRLAEQEEARMRRVADAGW